MDSTTQRLSRCFIAVFPAVDPRQLKAADPGTVDGWDSVATVTLVTVIEEEFHIEIDSDDIEYVLSFSAALDYVNRRLGAGATS
jgi:acyl carrier protein